MRIVHISTVHKVHDIRILFKECMTLANAGHDVFVIGRNDNLDIRNECTVSLIALTPVQGRIKRFFISQWEAFRKAKRLKGDIYHFHDPELIPTALLLRLFGKRVIYDVHEDVPLQLYSKAWIPGGLKPILKYLVRAGEFVCGASVSGVVAATPTIAEKFPAHKTIIIRNFPIVNEWKQSTVESYEKRPNRVIYCGSISRQQGIMQILEVAKLLKSATDIEVVIAGRFASKQLELEFERQGGKENTRFLGWIDRNQLAEEMVQAKIGIVIDHPIANYVSGYSTKLFEYMASGLPAIVSNIPFWVSMFERTGACIFVDPYDVSDIADQIRRLISDPMLAYKMGSKGRKAIEEEFNWGLDAQNLVSSYENLGRYGRFK